MRGLVSAGLLALYLVAAAAAAGAEVKVRQAEGVRVLEAAFSGPILDLEPVPGRGVAVLRAPADDPGGPRAIRLLETAGDGALTDLASDLDPETSSVHVLDWRGDGRAEVVACAPGKLYALGTPGNSEPRLILEAAHLDLAGLRRRNLLTPGGSEILLPLVGRLEIYRPSGPDGLAFLRQLELPVRTHREPTGLLLSTPPVSLVGRLEGGGPFLAVGPESHGKRRLLTTLLAADGGTSDAWAQLPADETIEQSWYAVVEGRPLLIVASLQSDKIGLFEKKKLRVFPLRPDRTRAGAQAILKVETETRRWHDLGVHIADVDHDGKEDLILIQPEGLSAGDLVVDAYLGKGGGGFYLTPRRSKISAGEPSWAYGEDVTGDGAPDLVTADDKGRVLVFPGVEGGRDGGWSRRSRPPASFSSAGAAMSKAWAAASRSSISTATARVSSSCVPKSKAGRFCG